MTQQPIYESLLAAWNEPDLAKRRRIVAATLAEGIRYDDPHRPAAVEGRAAFEEFLSQFRSALPDAVVRPDGSFQQVREHARAGFVIERAGRRFSRGTFVLISDPAGQIERIVGFMDEEPQR